MEQFSELFPSDRAVVEYLAEVRFGKNSRCPKCDANAHLFLRQIRRSMSCSQCSYEISVTSGIIFDHTRISLRTWYYLMLLISNTSSALSISFVARHLGVSRMAAFRMLSMIRLHLSRRCEGMIQGGGGKAIQIDETWISQVKNTRSARGSGAIVFGIYGQTGVFTKQIPNRSASVLMSEILQNTYPDSVFVTDQLRSYAGLSRLGLKHISFNHSKGEWADKGGYSSAGIESYWANLKYFLRSANLSPSSLYLFGYLAEHSFRYNCRKQGLCTFLHMISSFPRIEKNMLPRSVQPKPRY